MLEETGYASQGRKFLGSFITHGNYGLDTVHLVDAQNAIKVDEPDSLDLEETELLIMSQEELITTVRNGEFCLFSSMAMIAVVTNPLLS